MLCIIEHKEGKVGLLPVMSSLGIVSSEADYVFKNHYHRRRILKETIKEQQKQNFLSLKNAALKKYSNQSYAPGVLSSAAGPSGDVGSVPRVRSVATESYSTDQFVVLPFGPKWSAAKIVDVSTETKEIEVSYLESSDQYKTFTWSDEPKCWEFQSRILMKLSHP